MDKNVSSTVYGYKVDRRTATCPVFVTLHKSGDVSASTACGDWLIDQFSTQWLTRSRPTLASAEVAAIVLGGVEIDISVKKDDAQVADFYYLGRAFAEGATQKSLLDGEGSVLPVVEMTPRWRNPIDMALFDYFQPVLTV